MADKKLRRNVAPLSPINEVEEFVEEFRNALGHGEFDPYLYELVEALDARVADRMEYAGAEPDAFTTAFLRRVRRLRDGAPKLVPEACYTLLGAEYTSVVVRYLEPHEGKLRVEVLRSTSQKLAEGNTYRIPESALDRQVNEPEGK